MYQKNISLANIKMQEALGKFREELKTLRTGRANSALVEGVQVSYYGVNTPLKQMASITISDPSTILVTPWDSNSLADIELAIRNADLGLNPINDGRAVRIVLPPLTQERRQEFIKMVYKLLEEAKVVLRQIRQESWQEIKTMENEKKITEDDRYSAEEELNKIIDKFNKDLLKLSEDKEKELSTI